MRTIQLVIFLTWLIALSALAAKPPAFVASPACKSCHEKEYAAWSDSHHGWAWRLPEKENVLGDFNDVHFEHRGFDYRFITQDGKYLVVADGPDGKSTTYTVRYTVGVTPLQQYLVETDKGRLQALDLAWDTYAKRWYHLYPDQDTGAGNGMHWSGSYKNWNSRCAECHATDFHKNYVPATDSYASKQAEIGVGCEACHGAGEAHLAWAQAPDSFKSDTWQEVDPKGLIRTYDKGKAASEINLCAGCHSRREPLGSASPPVGADYNDHYRLTPLQEGMYYPDGQILEEVYVYGSFLQSKMYANGVKCTNCHDAHGYHLKADGNAVCVQCHNPAGNPLFPTLKKATYDAPEHHFHQPGTEGAQCKSCHMPERVYMGVDGRRDHSFRIPMPDLSTKLGTPNPCSTCHVDKGAEWASEEIRKRFPNGRIGKLHFAEVFSQAGKSPAQAPFQALLQIAKDEQQPDMVRASALQHMSRLTDDDSMKQLAPLLKDPSPLVRSAAILTQKSRQTADATKLIAPLLTDSAKSVRLEAAKASLGVATDDLPQAQQMHLARAMKELQQSLLARADFPETQMVLGGVALTLRNLDAATSAFRRAVEMDPQLTDAWLILLKIYAAQDDRDNLAATLASALRHNPENEELIGMRRMLDQPSGE